MDSKVWVAFFLSFFLYRFFYLVHFGRPLLLIVSGVVFFAYAGGFALVCHGGGRFYFFIFLFIFILFLTLPFTFYLLPFTFYLLFLIFYFYFYFLFFIFCLLPCFIFFSLFPSSQILL